MAFIYRFDKICDEKSTDIEKSKDVDREIYEILSFLYVGNLKSYNYNAKKDSFIFSLFESSSNGKLRWLGRKLAQKGLRGYQRQKLEMIGFIHRENEMEEDIYVEFIPNYASYFEEIEDFEEAANNYYQRNDYVKHINNEFEYLTASIKKNLYMDIFTVNLSNENNKKFLNLWNELLDKNNFAFFELKCIHRHFTNKDNCSSNKTRLFVDNDTEVVTNYEYAEDGSIDVIEFNKHDIEHLSINDKWLNLFDLKLPNIKNNNFSIKNEFQNFSSFYVHDVGQALATSLYVDERPGLYFDYGTDGKYKRKLDVRINADYRTKIILSHIHKDHWSGLYYNKDAYRCDWYIPKQDNISKTFIKKMSEVLTCNGSVHIIPSGSINFEFGELIKCQNVNSSSSAGKHGDGIIMYLNLQKNNKTFNVLVPGDQAYNDIDHRYLSNLDILVATHHGGEYNYSNLCNKRFPKPKGPDSIVIYSYGKDNRYNHPSKVDDYDKENWLQSFYTEEKKRDFDFQKDI